MTQELDAVIVSSHGFVDASHMATDKAVRLELDLDGQLAHFDFLDLYFRNGRDLARAREQWEATPATQKMPTYLGGVYLSDFLQKKLGLRVRIVNAFRFEKQRLERLLSLRPRFVILSTTMITVWDEVREIAAFIRERAPETTIIAGGLRIYKSHKIREAFDRGDISDFPRERLARYNAFFGSKDDAIDYYVVNPRGESTLLRLISALRGGADPGTLENVAYYRDRDTLCVNPVTDEPNHLKDWSIDWTCIEDDVIGSEIPITMKQGCPYRCNYCDFIALDREVAGRSMDTVVAELRRILDRYGRKDIFFVDENLFFNKAQLRAFCSRLIAEGLNIRWRGLARATCIDEETVDLLMRSGCYTLSMGVESFDDQILRNMNKACTGEQNVRAIRLLAEAGVDPYFTFVVGFPGETADTVRRTVEVIRALPRSRALKFYHALPFLILPLSPAAARPFREAHGLVGYQNRWHHRTMDFEEAAAHVQEMFAAMEDTYLRYLNCTESSLLRNSVPQHRAVLDARQRIVQHRLRGGAPAGEAPLWDAMEQAFAALRGERAGRR